jgi:hypothetical protein
MSLPVVGQYFNSPLSQITPFTYRDGETFLEQLKRLRHWIDHVSAVLQANIDLVAADDAAANLALANELNAILTAFTNKWEGEFLNLLDQEVDVAKDPTTGQVSALNVVISHIYDNTRYYAYFADQLDQFNKSAADWDAMQYTARHFDLTLGYSPTSTQGTDTVPATVQPN